MGKTPIEWTEHSINPIRARDKITGEVGHFCEKISPGCKHCYASRLQTRFRMHEFIAANREKVELFLDSSVLAQVLRRRKPTTYFWCDMTDLFYSGVRDEWIDACFGVMALTPHHTHQVLTKRVNRALRYMQAPARQLIILDEVCKIGRTIDRFSEELNRDKKLWGSFTENWPLPQVHFGCSVENQEYADERRDDFEKIPAVVKYVSYEPACGPVNWEGWSFVHQIIAGGESGPDARPPHPDWFRRTRDWCQANNKGFFFKQRGEWTWDYPQGFSLAHRAETYQHGISLYRIGKKNAGRLLDGREWNEPPMVINAELGV